MNYNHSNQNRNSRNRQPQPDVEVEEGQRFPLTIKRLGINGEGIGYYKHKTVFIPGALPDEVVVAEVTRIHARYLDAKIHKIRTKSPNRVEPRDAYAGNVGGFELEHLAYPAQLQFKRDVVVQSLEKYHPRGYMDYELRPTIGMEDPYAYRNKAQFQIRKIDDKVVAGLYKEGTHEVVDLETCSVQYPLTMTIMRAVVKMLQDLDVPIYDEEAESGIVKTVVIRVAVSTQQAQLVFVTNSQKLPKKRELLERIEAELPDVVSVMQNVNPGKTSLIWGEETKPLAGKTYIEEYLNKLRFNLSARAFLQLNPFMTEQLYAEGLKGLNLTADDNVIDAYSGVGTIGLSIASSAKEVRGMDTIAESVDDANQNAKQNGIQNAHYVAGKAEDVIPQWLALGWEPTALIVDPPRTGLDDTLLETILTTRPEKFVYISCNPSTMAQDLVKLTEVYNVDYIQSVDMMPQTARCEAVVRMHLR
ncbi:23S rRNA (uracil(1939)-C(5))-methyltransferase RlmD [Secundilactobacillus malefermentans]|uniref:23S rRNA (uracil(1939)-C(5))-methyltransferase RlmD n=1 Tax=Secundilactobacillus malefermentans TaxID=176292 RepID=UPI0011CACC69|nr:23S rRNA (uracil(1939)-C(5))-methyltransferase RlmD [Secundilactobacillus malefermentans]QEA31731.1 23S rRNA (uracil(1939)-C(5))-methyltransferase RlmD [Secundilactobacillus malefermentans]